MPSAKYQPAFVLLFRLAMAWTFLDAASHQVLNPDWSVVDFLAGTETFRDVYGVFTGARVASIVTLLVAWGHLLIGVSLLIGLLVPVSASVGALLMLLYWAAYMDFPYIDGSDNFIVDFHLVYAVILLYLAVVGAGQILGLDAWVTGHAVVHRHTWLKRLVS